MKKPTKLQIIGFAVAASLVTGSFFATRGGAEFDLPGLDQKVQRQGEQLENHEARITNTENDVADLQTNTNTAPSPNRVSVPSVTTPAPITSPVSNPTPEPALVTVVAYEQLAVSGSEDMDCKLTYSDGTSYTWRWETVTYNQGIRLVHRVNKCDPSVAGTIKL